MPSAKQNFSPTFIWKVYEGIDARLNIEYVNEAFSIEIILSGGELAAMVMIDAIARLKPGVLNNADSATYESHSQSGSLLEHPYYTRPATWRGHSLVLRVGTMHLQAWRREESLKTTARSARVENIDLTPEERSMLEQIRRETNHDQV